jgi:hypothetical protein
MAPLFKVPFGPSPARFDYEIWSYLGRRWERVRTSLTTAEAARVAGDNDRRGLVQSQDYRFVAF